MAKASSTEKWVLLTELNGEPLLHHFKISDQGKVVKIKKGKGEEALFEPKFIGGYNYISFTTKKGNRFTIYVHRLVAEFFVYAENKDDLFVIHADYNRANNTAENLKWVPKEVLYKHRAAKAGRIAGKPSRKVKLQAVSERVQIQALRETAAKSKLYTEVLGIH